MECAPLIQDFFCVFDSGDYKIPETPRNLTSQEMNSTRPTRPPETALVHGLGLRPSITKKIEIDQSPIPIYKEHKIIEKLQVNINTVCMLPTSIAWRFWSSGGT